MNRRVVFRKRDQTGPVYRRGVPERRGRRRAYLFVRAPGRRRQEKLLDLLRRRNIFAAFVLVIALPALAYFALPRSPVSPLASPPEEAESGAGEETGVRETLSQRFLQRILGDEIPGLEPPPPLPGEEIYGALCRAVSFLTGIDPGNICSVLDLELGQGSGVAIPVILPHSSAVTAGPDIQEPELPSWGGSLFPFPITGGDDPPIFLYHTHASEAFTAGTGKNAAMDRTVVAVGGVLAQLLEENYGLPVLHHRAVYDQPRNYAYSKARPVIEGLLAENRGVRVVVDLHRDGVARAKTTACLEGKDFARLLLVVGSRNPAYEENLAFALRLHDELEAILPGLSRGIFDRDFTYNQDLHEYALLIEVGGHENSLDEALLSLPFLAEALARTYYVFFMQD